MEKGMFVDTSICTGCKACQVACKEWNQLEAEPLHFKNKAGYPYPVAVNFTGDSYDNTGALSGTNWRRVKFIEQFDRTRINGRWLFSSDSCKHCKDAGCLNACPVNAIIRTDLGNVVVQQDVCVGLGECVKACPFRVIAIREKTGTANKCTLCNDRIHNGLGTACAKACPTGSISYGDLADLKKAADARLEKLKKLGNKKANIYGYKEAGGLNVFYLLLDSPALYGLPVNPVVPQRKKAASSVFSFPSIIAAIALIFSAFISCREQESADGYVSSDRKAKGRKRTINRKTGRRKKEVLHA